jgi:hypothetical protein
MPKQGDVICVHADGWAWGECELGGRAADPANNPLDVGFAAGERVFTQHNLGKVKAIAQHINGNHAFWRVIKLPSVTVNQALSMVAPEVDVDPLNPSPYLQFRAFFLDKSKIPPATMQALLDNWNDDGRANGFISLNYTAAQIASIKTQRTPIPFP